MNYSTKSGVPFLLSLLLLLVISCTPENSQREFSEGRIVDEKNHIHSLAFDPTEPGVMYVGTHYYLEKINLQTGEKEQIGRYGEDYMGFVIAADGTFYSSGHSPQVANVGIRKSTNKGKTWQTLAYEGYDFHEMATPLVDPNQIYAWSTPPEEFLTFSRDGGKTWGRVSSLQGLRGSIFALEADKQQTDKLYAGTLFGLFVSEDGGKNWVPEEGVKNLPIIAITDDVQQEGKLTLATADKILQSNDGGKTWQDIAGNFNQKEEVIVFLTTDSATGNIYGVTKHSKVYVYEESKGWNDFSLRKE